MTRMRLGIENKRQVYLFAGLCLLMLLIAGSELQSAFSSPKSTIPHRTISVQQAAPNQNLSIVGAEPKLHTTQLNHSEQVTYSGRDIFSLPLTPVHIEAPIASPRPVLLPAPLPERPSIPTIDIKYLGYAKTGGDGSYKAVLVRGDDTLMAGSGEVIFHRFKVGSIQPTSVQITDLSLKNTQVIAASEK